MQEHTLVYVCKGFRFFSTPSELEKPLNGYGSRKTLHTVAKAYDRNEL
jgi:hypothetical protein